MKRGDLSINLVIIAAIAVVVLVIVLAIVTGRVNILNQKLNECPAQARCMGEWSQTGEFTNGQQETLDIACDPQFETDSPTATIKGRQPSNRNADDLIRCSVCCIRA